MRWGHLGLQRLRMPPRLAMFLGVDAQSAAAAAKGVHLGQRRFPQDAAGVDVDRRQQARPLQDHTPVDHLCRHRLWVQAVARLMIDVAVEIEPRVGRFAAVP